MGVFARLFRKAKATEEASTAEAQADAPAAESEAQGTDEGKRPKRKIAPEGPGAGDDVEIPKQQTAEQAADNGAGESAAHDCCPAGR
ncbi:hypothetical protein GCM10010344_57940 [Streptomyces bluensis]|nr:hypothetical protein GCM10010344_57940 [Streptomyces bluensis]